MRPANYIELVGKTINGMTVLSEFEKDEKRLVVELCEELNLDYSLVSNRKRKGKTGDDLFKPKMIRNKNKI